MSSLLDRYEQALSEGMTRAEFAEQEGMREGQLKWKLETLRNPTKGRLSEGEERKVNKIYVEEIGENLRSVSAVTDSVKRIWTLEQLFAACDIDPDEWDILKVITNKWEGYRKHEEKDLIYDEGQATGYVKDDGTLVVEPLIQIKAWLVRKTPVEIRPAVKPIVFSPERKPPKRTQLNRKYETRLINSDAHFGFTKSLRTGKLTPFHDRRALDIALQLAEIYRPEEIIWLGDLADLAQFTDKFIRSPEFHMTMQPTVFEISWWLYQFNRHAKQKVLQGNHDIRIETAVQSHMEYAYDLRPVKGLYVSMYPALSLPNLVGMEVMDIDWIDGYPDNKYWINDRLCVEHGNIALANPGYTAYKMIEKREYSTIFGHIHRRESVSRMKRDRKGSYVVEAICPGFLGHVDGRVPGHGHGENWSQGILVVHSREDGWYDWEQVRIDDGVALYRGEYIVGVDRTEEIESYKDVGF